MTTLLTGATVVDARGVRAGSWVLVQGETIAAIGTGEPPADAWTTAEHLELHGAVVTPGLIDLHSHGGGGHSFDDGATEIRAAVGVHRGRGTTRGLISLVANPVARILGALGEIADTAGSDPTILGSHLEGPFLSPDNRGAHHPDFLVAPTPALVDDLIEAGRGTLRQVTIAPELPGALDAIERFVAAGVRVALGHTTADYDIARAGFDRGATLLTHAFNAMPGLHHRAPGPVAAAFDDERVTLELILDGVHVDPAIARVLFASAPGRVALITDAMAAAGAPDGAYRLGSLDVTVRGGTATLTGTPTIAGSTLTLDRALAMAVNAVGLPPEAAVGALTSTPARVLGLGDRFGLVEPGYVADLVAWSIAWEAERVWIAGRTQ